MLFTLAITSSTTSSLPWFMDLTFHVPMQYCCLPRVKDTSTVLSICYNSTPLIGTKICINLLRLLQWNYYRPDGLNDRNIFSLNRHSGQHFVKIGIFRSLIPCFVNDYLVPMSSYGLSILQISSGPLDIGHVGLGLTLITSLYLNYLFELN